MNVFAERCTAAGLDLCAPVDVGAYNRAVDAKVRLPDFGRGACLGYVVGNTRAIWEPFLERLARDTNLLTSEHPLQAYVEDAVAGAVRAGIEGRFEVRYSHEPPPRLYAAQRLAQIAGLAYLAESYLSVHSVYGPWVAWRAVVILDAPPPKPATPPQNPCSSCESACLKHLRALLANGTPKVERDWRAWVAMRDACPLGGEHRYSDEQIRYHYTKDRDYLRALVRARAKA